MHTFLPAPSAGAGCLQFRLEFDQLNSVHSVQHARSYESSQCHSSVLAIARLGKSSLLYVENLRCVTHQTLLVGSNHAFPLLYGAKATTEL